MCDIVFEKAKGLGRTVSFYAERVFMQKQWSEGLFKKSDM